VLVRLLFLLTAMPKSGSWATNGQQKNRLRILIAVEQNFTLTHEPIDEGVEGLAELL
jgi:hypothetical protein